MAPLLLRKPEAKKTQRKYCAAQIVAYLSFSQNPFVKLDNKPPYLF
jgi:hypothetical protein